MTWADTIKEISLQRIIRQQAKRREQWRLSQQRRRGPPKGHGYRHALRGEDGRFRAGRTTDAGTRTGANVK